jgi:succinate-semialdehyde dehydrogenase/glutarate-semialdehyde dehydrogenase
VTNPATGEVVEEFPTATDAEIADALDRSHREFASWRTRSVSERAALMHKVAEIYRERQDELARIISTEMGKLLKEAKGELALTANIYDYYAENAEAFTADEPVKGTDAGKAVIQKRPVGSILGIMPWNYPYYQVARFAAPNLALGNTVLLKHAPSCPRSAAAMEQIFHDAGVPADAYINIYATNEQVEQILEDPRNQGVSLTGSERAGSAVAAIAGKNLKKVVLELGGSDPFVVLDAADVEQMAETAFRTRLGNTGQACNSPKRMIVHEDLYEDFVASITEKAKNYTPGDPTEEGTTLAPLSSRAAAENFVDQVKETVSQGATLLAGGDLIDGPGAFVQPTVLTDVKPGMRAYKEELFGPAIMVFKVSDEDEAVALANDTPFGLGSAVFSTDPEKARRVGEQIDAGMVFINETEASKPHLPFGGVKRSGIGRELGPLAMEEFCNKRLVKIA